MNRSLPPPGASRRQCSEETASPTSHVDQDDQESSRDKSNEEEDPNKELPLRRSARKKRGVLSPSQTTLMSFFSEKDPGHPPCDEPNGKGATDSHDEDFSDGKEVVKPSNDQDQDLSTRNENGTSAQVSKAEEKSEHAKDERQAPLEADKGNETTGTGKVDASLDPRTDEWEELSHGETSAVSHDKKDAPSGPSAIEGHDDVGQHGTSSLVYILPRPLTEIAKANVHFPGEDGVCRTNKSPRAWDSNQPSDESPERNSSTSPQSSFVCFAYTSLEGNKVGTAEHEPTDVQRVGSEQPETQAVSLDSTIAFEGAAGNDHEEPLKLFASPQVLLNPLHLLSQVSVGMAKAEEVVLPSNADDSSRLMKQEGQDKIDGDSEVKGTVSHTIPNQRQVENNSTSEPPNEATLYPSKEIVPSSDSATPVSTESAGVSTAQHRQGEVPDDAARAVTSARDDNQDGLDAKPSDVTQAISLFGGDGAKRNFDEEGSDIPSKAPTLPEVGCEQNGIGPTLTGQVHADFSPQEKSLFSASTDDIAFDKQLVVDETCIATVASNEFVETQSLDGPFAKLSEHAEDAVPDSARAHSLSDAQESVGSAIRQGADNPASVSSSLVQVSMQAQDTEMKMALQREPSSSVVSPTPQHEFLDVEDVKIRLYDIGSRVHRGKSPERRFAAYWEALSCFLSFRLQRGGRSTRESIFDRIRNVLESFLKTKQMRRLHNLLIMGLMEQCTKDYVIDNGIRHHIPIFWQEKIRTHRVDTKSISPLPVSETDSGLDLSAYDRLSEIWTATGRQPLLSHSVHVAASSSALVTNERVQLPRHSLCLPGVLSVDPLVRLMIKDAAMKVSEMAIWIIVVAVREYVLSLLKNTLSNLESVTAEHSLTALDFHPCAMRSGNMGKTRITTSDFTTDVKQNGSSEKGVTGIKHIISGQKRRCISSLDIAATLNRTRMAPDESMAGSITPLSFDRCLHASINGNCVSLPPAFDSVQSFIVESIQSASKKQKHEWPDPSTVAAAVPSDISNAEESSQKTCGDNSSSTNSHLRIGELGKEGKNFAALQARMAAMTAPPELTPVAPSTAMSDGDNNGATVAPTTHPNPVVERSTPPRGRGRGFGVKNLAAMRARSSCCTPSTSSDNNPAADPPASSSQQGSKVPLEYAHTTTANASVPLGMDLQNLQEVQDTSPLDVSSTGDEARGVSVLYVQGHADTPVL